MNAKLKPIAAQTIVITGATSGIGRAAALMASKRGAQVALIARREKELAALAGEIAKGGGRAVYVVADVGVEREVEGAADQIIADCGGFDTWVNNAGVAVYAPTASIPSSDHARVFQTNYWGAVYGSAAAVRHFVYARGAGALINVGSVSGAAPAPRNAAFAASKHALRAFTDALRLELADEGAPVSVTLVKPWSVDTSFDSHTRSHLDAEPLTPRPALAPEMVAEAILYAARHGARDITVGGAGKLATAIVALTPSLADRLVPSWFMRVQRGVEGKRAPLNALYSPAEKTLMRASEREPWRFDLFHALRMHPRIALGLTASLGVALAAAVRGRRTLEPRAV